MAENKTPTLLKKPRDWQHETVGNRLDACRAMLSIHGYISKRQSDSIRRHLIRDIAATGEPIEFKGVQVL